MVAFAPGPPLSTDALLDELDFMAARARRLRVDQTRMDLSDRRLASSFVADLAAALSQLDHRLGARLPERHDAYGASINRRRA